MSTHAATQPRARRTRGISDQRLSRGALPAWLSTLTLTLITAYALGAATAQAQSEADAATRAAARRLGTQGIEAYWANDFVTASDKLDRAFQLYETGTLGLWSARSRVQLGQLVEGAERYREAIRANIVGDVEAQQKAQREAREELESLVPRIPTLTIHVRNARPEEIDVTLDNELIPSALLDEARPTNPGNHSVVVTRGNQRQERRVQLAEGEQKQLAFELREQAGASVEPLPQTGDALTLTPVQTAAPQPAAAATEASPSPLQPIGLITLAFGTAGLATAGITALIANGKRSQCPNDECPADIKDSYDALKTVSTVAFYGGAGLALGGLVMWLAAPRPDAPPPTTSTATSTTTPTIASWSVGPTGVQVSGSF